jgi:hypothetical protein
MRVAQAVTHSAGSCCKLRYRLILLTKAWPFKALLAWSYNPPLNAIGVPELQTPIIPTAIAIFGHSANNQRLD